MSIYNRYCYDQSSTKCLCYVKIRSSYGLKSRKQNSSYISKVVKGAYW